MFDPGGIPDELKVRRQWIVWRYEGTEGAEGDGGRKTKVPYIAVLVNDELTYRASSTKKKHWKTFNQAVTVAREHADGIGYVFSADDPYAVADFDDALHEGEISTEAAGWIERLDSYTEVSVSGGGFHVICRAEVGAGAAEKGFEVYDRARYIALTGDVFDTRHEIREGEEAFSDLVTFVRAEQAKHKSPRRLATKPYEGPALELVDYLNDSDVVVLRQCADAGSEKYAIICPWHDEHTGGDVSGTFVGQYSDGATWFKCHHAHCAGREWREFRAKTDPEERSFRDVINVTFGQERNKKDIRHNRSAPASALSAGAGAASGTAARHHSVSAGAASASAADAKHDFPHLSEAAPDTSTYSASAGADFSSSEVPSGVELIDVASLGEGEVPPPREYFVDKLVPEACATMIYGDGGVSKSMLCLSLGVAVAGGLDSWLGFDVKEGNVLYLDFELSADEQYRRADKISKGLGLNKAPSGLFYVSTLGHDIKSAFFSARYWAERHDIKLLIVDSLGVALEGDAEVSKDVIGFYKEYVYTMLEAGISIILVDHQAKSQGRSYQTMTSFGSVYKRNLVRSEIQVEARDQDEEAGTLDLIFRHKKHNFGPKTKPFGGLLTFHPDRITLESTLLDEETLSQEQGLDVKDRALLAVYNAESSVSKRDIAEATGMADGSAKNAITSLKKKKYLTDTGERDMGMVKVAITQAGVEFVENILVKAKKRRHPPTASGVPLSYVMGAPVMPGMPDDGDEEGEVF